MTYFFGIAFLFFVSAMIALFFQSVIKNRFFAVCVSTIVSTVVLKTWAYFDIGGFDYVFLIIVVGVAFAASVTVELLSNLIKKRHKFYLRES